MVAQSFLMGGHVRVGLEDNFYLGQGCPGGIERQLVEKAVGIVRSLGGELASPAEAREILGLAGAMTAPVQGRLSAADAGERPCPATWPRSLRSVARRSPRAPRLVALPEFATYLDRSSKSMRASATPEAESAALARTAGAGAAASTSGCWSAAW